MDDSELAPRNSSRTAEDQKDLRARRPRRRARACSADALPGYRATVEEPASPQPGPGPLP